MRCRERARNTEEKRRERRETVSTTAKPPPPLMMAWTLTLVYHHIHPGRFFFSSHFSFVKIYHPIAFKAWLKNSVFFNSSEAISRKNVAPAGRLQRGPPGAPLARPPPTGGGGRGGFIFAETVHCSGPECTVTAYWRAGATRAQPYKFTDSNIGYFC